MEVLAKVAFGIYTAVIIGGSVFAVSSTSLVRALVGLITTLVGVAGMYLLLASPFMAFMQLLIYVGAVSVLIFFAVMLTRAESGGDESAPAPMKTYVFGLAATIAPAAVLGWLVMTRPVQSIAIPTEVDIKQLGEGLLGTYFLPFELISVILMVAMAGAVLLTWEKRGKK
ncbi:MAG: NADH-quinone oxidoreductase subunit J [Pseudodesulfovibrio sp.]|uniref:NADH-quinone oxidoreductase subunit J n=1 Tax=Pseudodesulfovibrio aespoeensis (strain ATCC 700646 / DSM 10631 / Aspo-2) TaxID=643562 RepID=E6VUR7_PSEA9|nr:MULTISPECIES: NADH-quinone oxidoreductase subunit J [Pseudodesulfovibrio]MBU4243400.1 NADH-quinone oxidoreductase subunit J [Pseudomonadota bacterium]ADU62308.1 NADH-ubiquinone/plastoquinone oxidoreductase chain 6 [Pseudodesulfovibrio aespoeensis Aspo-2]MBU4379864.1 NADH-quinone oxidoreductase subunit J [Pseudomonadota bacterium]MBU4474027.1 NADH-quinone oxidoreductase subunit J [Pseudomonadota bacterium]MBU4515225.1 NADH-quinone oxidoreductase subunit J [Pseudomonadota bacterium]